MHRSIEHLRRGPAALLSLALVVIPSGARAYAAAIKDAVLDADALSQVPERRFGDLCAARSTGVRCLGKVVVDESGGTVRAPEPMDGLRPQDLRSAYAMAANGGAGATIAIVGAYHYDRAEADLATYRAKFGLPPCTGANGCFRQVDSGGNQSALAADPSGCAGWAGEVALDLQVASAMCPDCVLLLVEVDGANTFTDGGMASAGPIAFSHAVDTAVRLGARAVSNSYGWSEDLEVPGFSYPDVLITAPTGDTGFGETLAPATYPGVLAVGGTTLTRSSSSRGWAESAWQNGGSACSGRIAKPSWQKDLGCGTRVVADVSAVANPGTGLAVYCTDDAGAGWQIGGGASAAAPLVAGAWTLQHLPPTPGYAWQHPTDFFDITLGSNGSACPVAYLCNAGEGYDGPTGWGSPNGHVPSPPPPPSEGHAAAPSGASCAAGGSAPRTRAGLAFVSWLVAAVAWSRRKAAPRPSSKERRNAGHHREPRSSTGSTSRPQDA